jgi:hypothetical protein
MLYQLDIHSNWFVAHQNVASIHPMDKREKGLDMLTILDDSHEPVKNKNTNKEETNFMRSIMQSKYPTLKEGDEE